LVHSRTIPSTQSEQHETASKYSFLQEAVRALADDRIYGAIIIGAVHSCKTTNGKRALVGIETHENWLSISNPAQ